MKKILVNFILVLIVVIFTALSNVFVNAQPGPNLALKAKVNNSGGGADVYGDGPSNLNDNVICSGGNCYGWVETDANPDPFAWIELDWGTNLQMFDQLTIYVNNSTDRALAGATLQVWNGTSYRNYYSYNFSHLTSMSYTVKFPVITATKIRITNIYTIGSLSPSIEEIQVRLTTGFRTDAGMTACNNPPLHIVPGSANVTGTIMNMGKDSLKTAGLRWSVDGIPQTSPSNWTGKLATLGYDSNKLFGSYNFPAGVHAIKLWTVNPNGSKDSNNYNDTFIKSIYVCNKISGTYVIDGGGTGDFKTFNDALKWVYACGLSGPVKFRVKPGVYSEQLTLTSIPGANSVNTLTFESYALDSSSVTLNYANTSWEANWVVLLSGASHVFFKSLTIQANSPNYGCVVNIADGSDSNVFMNNVIRTAYVNSWYFAGFYFSNWTTGGTVDEYNVIKNNVISGGYMGIYLYGSGSPFSMGNVINHNIIKNFYYYGISAVYQDGLIITGNKIGGSDIPADYTGIDLGFCNNFELSGNKIDFLSMNQVYGINMWYINDGSGPFTGEIYNNFINLRNQNSSSSVGIQSYYCSYFDIYYNTINILDMTSYSYNIYLYDGTSNSVNFRNNILTNTGDGYTIYMGTTNILNSSDFNDLYTTGSYLAYWTNDCYDLSDWQSASSMDYNSLNKPVTYYSNKDLHLNSAVVNGKGKTITGFTTDIDGESRGNPPDLGADEFNLVTNDAGISELVNPLAPCIGLNPVVVKIKSYGSAALTSVKVNWQVNGVIQSPATFSVSLTQYQETSVTLGSYTFAAGTSYKIKCWTSLPNGTTDGNSRNDSCYYTISKTALNGTFIIGYSPSDYLTFNDAVNDLLLKGVCGPVLFRVKAGIYNEKISIPKILGTSSTNTVTFESFNLDSNSVEITGNTDIGSYYVVELNNASYVKFRLIKFQVFCIYNGYCIHITGNSDHCTLTNNIISSPSNASSGSIAGIFSDNTDDNYFLISNNLITGGYYGVYLLGSNYSSGELYNVVLGNTIKDFYNTGLYMESQESPLVKGNYIECNARADNTTNGIYSYYCYDSLRIIKNKIHLAGPSENYGIQNYYTQGSTSTNGLIANNFVSVTGSSTATNMGISNYYCSNLNVYYNNVNIAANALKSGMAFYCVGGNGTNVANNIFSNPGGGYAYYFSGSVSSFSSSNYNDLYTSGSVLGYWNADKGNIALWKSAASPQETKSLSVNPYYYSATDLHVYSKLLDSMAIPVAIIKDDIDNEARNLLKPDIGADEFKIGVIDGSVTDLISPAPACPGVLSNVIVRLRNYGTAILKTTKIKWSVNGVAQKTLGFSGNIPNLKDTALNLGTYTFIKGVHYNIKFWIDTVNSTPDQNRLNDTLKFNNFHAAFSGSYTIGQSGRDYPDFTSVVNDLVNSGICGAVTFLADSGTYAEQISLPYILGSSAINTITFQSATKDSSSVVLEYAAAGMGDNYVVELNGAKYIHMEKMTFRANGMSGYANVIDIKNGASYNVIRGNVIESSNYWISSNAIPVFNNSNGVPSNYNVIDNNVISYGYYSIQLTCSSSNPGKGNIIKNNRISDFYEAGIHASYQDSIEINKNVFNCTAGSWQAYGLYLEYLTNSCNINANQIYIDANYNMYGIFMNYCTAKLTAYMMVTNNIVSLYGKASGATYGLYSGYCYAIKHYHNSFNVECGSSSNCYSVYMISPTTGTYGKIDLQNNIIVNTGGGYAIYVNQNAATLGYLLRSNFNDYFITGTYIGHYGNSDAVTIANWRTISGQDPKSYVLIPPFKSSTDLHLSTYTGMTISNALGLVKDVDGDLRSTKIPVIGADENPHIPYDAGIQGITSPPRVACDGIMPVTATLYNYGLNNIDSVFVDYLINGIVKKTIQYKGSLSFMGSTTISFGMDTFSASKPTKIKIRTRLPNGKTSDTCTSNDADSVSLKLFAFPVIKSTLNDTICKGDTATLKVFSPNSQIFAWYDSVVAGKLVSVDSIFKTGPLGSTKTYYVEAGTPGTPGSISTDNSTLSSEMGNMFNITATVSDITIDSFAIHPAAGVGLIIPVSVYYRAGSYVGKETNASAWTYVGTDTIISSGPSKFISISTGGVKMKKGQTFGFYVSSIDPTMLLECTSGSKVYTDYYLQISTGTKTFFPFDAFYQSGYSWNGVVYYETGSMCRSTRVPVVADVRKAPKINLGKDTMFCKGGKMTLNAGYFGNGYVYDWRYGSGTKTISTKQSITVDSTGAYRVIVKDVCSNVSSDTLKLSVNPIPDAIFGTNYSNHCLSGNAFLFTNHSTVSSGNVKTFAWNFGDGTIKNDSNPLHTYLTADTFLVRLRIFSNFNCTDSAQTTLIVHPQPQVAFSVDKPYQCLQGNLFKFTNNTSISNGTISGQNWSLGDGNFSSVKNVNHSYTKDDTFYVKLVSVSNKGCSDSSTKMIIINPQPKALFSISDTNQCLNTNLFVLTNGSAVKKGSLKYQWSLGDFTTLTDTDCKHTYKSAGSYKVWLKVTSDSGCIDSVSHVAHVKPNPTVYLGKDTTLVDKQSIILDGGAGRDNYLWSTGSINRQITVDSNGIGFHSKLFWVTVTKDLCTGTDSILITFKKGTGIDDVDRYWKMKYYPNPADDYLYVEITGLNKTTSISITDAQGKEYMSLQVNPSAGMISKKFNLSGLSEGVYFIRVFNEDVLKVGKFIKN